MGATERPLGFGGGRRTTAGQRDAPRKRRDEAFSVLGNQDLS